MKNKTFLLTLSLLLFLSSFLPSQSYAENNNSQGTSFNLDLSLNTGDKAKKIYNAENFKKGSQYYYEKDLSQFKSDKAQIHLKITRENSQEVTAEGHMKIDGIQYKFSSLEGNLEEKGDLLLGGVSGQADTKNGSTDVELYIVSDKNDVNDAFVSATIGAISAKGTSIIVFGELPDTYIVSEQLNNDNPGSNSSKISAVSAKKQSSLPTLSNSLAYTSSSDPYNHRTSVYGTRAADSSTDTIPTTGYEATGEYVIGLNAFDRDPSVNGNGSGTANIRLWSISENVDQYAGREFSYSGDPGFGVDLAIIKFYEADKSGTINIINHAPTNDTPDSIAWKWISFIASATRYEMVANAAEYVYNQLTPYFTTGYVFEPRTEPASNNRIYLVEVKVRDLNRKIDWVGSVMPDATYSTKGGLTATFDYAEYGAGTNALNARGRIRYLGYVGYPIYLFTDEYTLTWNANFAS